MKKQHNKKESLLVSYLFGFQELDDIIAEVAQAEDEYEASEVLASKVEQEPELLSVLAEYIGADPTYEVTHLALCILREEAEWCLVDAKYSLTESESKPKRISL